MKINLITHNSPPTYKTNFTNEFRFYIDLTDYESMSQVEQEREAEKRLNELCTWCCETFEENFVLMEEVSAIVAGGSENNLKEWKQQRQRVKRNDYAALAQYKLCCETRDATWFKMKFV